MDWFSFYDENLSSSSIFYRYFLFSFKELFFAKILIVWLTSRFLPYLIWTISIDPYLDQNIIFYLISKFKSLSSDNNFSQPFYYYLWNIPITFLPWTFSQLLD